MQLFFLHLFCLEAKEQILANLANFAYDPRNMKSLRMLQVTELFLDMLTEENDNFVEFGIGEYNQTGTKFSKIATGTHYICIISDNIFEQSALSFYFLPDFYLPFCLNRWPV